MECLSDSVDTHSCNGHHGQGHKGGHQNQERQLLAYWDSHVLRLRSLYRRPSIRRKPCGDPQPCHSHNVLPPTESRWPVCGPLIPQGSRRIWAVVTFPGFPAPTHTTRFLHGQWKNCADGEREQRSLNPPEKLWSSRGSYRHQCTAELPGVLVYNIGMMFK